MAIKSYIFRVAAMLAIIFLLSACGQDDKEEGNGAAGSRQVSVTLAEAKTGEIQVELYSIGRLVSKNTPTLAAEINARVIEFLVDEGQVVSEGQELILLDTTTTELSRREARAAIQRLEVSIANEERRVARYRDLKKKDMMPQERLDDAEAKLAVDRASLTAALARLAIADDRLAKARMVSPVNGIVEKRHVSVGDYAKVGSPLITVTDTVSLRAELPFPETVGSRLRLGQELILSSPLAPGLDVQAAITQIRPQVGLMSRALMVIAEISNPGPWRPEATVEASAIVERRSDAVLVPQMAVARRPAGDVVFVVDSREARQVRQQVVTLGQRKNGHVEILSGIEQGDIVVADGAYYLSDGAGILVQGNQ